MRYALIYHCEVCEVTNVNDEMFEQKKKVVQKKAARWMRTWRYISHFAFRIFYGSSAASRTSGCDVLPEFVAAGVEYVR